MPKKTKEPTVILKDERNGKPSASSMDSDLRCPGRRKLMEYFELKDDTKSDAADLGTLIHAVLAGQKKMEELTESGKVCAERIMQQEASLVECYGFEKPDKVFSEERLWMTDDEMESIASGQPDRVYLKGDEALLINYKTGYAAGIPITNNYQIKFESALVAFYHPVHKVHGNLIHPNYGSVPVESITYTREELLKWMVDVIRPAIKVILSGEAMPTAGFYQCRYCPVGKKSLCPALNEKNKGAIQSGGKELVPIEHLTPKERGDRLLLLIELESFIKGERERTKEKLLDDPKYVEGWSMRSLSSQTLITSFSAACIKLLQWLKQEDINDCVSLSLPKVINRVAKKNNTTQAAAKALIRSDLAAVIKRVPKKPSLVPNDAPVEEDED